MNVLEYLIPEYFFGALLAGIIICLWHKPEVTVITKHPTPFNAGKVLYKNALGDCYEYAASKQDCPGDKSLVKDFQLAD